MNRIAYSFPASIACIDDLECSTRLHRSRSLRSTSARKRSSGCEGRLRISSMQGSFSRRLTSTRCSGEDIGGN
jgi:hypothetical protein